MTKTIGLLSRLVNRASQHTAGAMLIQQATITLMRSEASRKDDVFSHIRKQLVEQIQELSKQLVKARSEGSQLRGRVNELLQESTSYREAHDTLRKQWDEAYDALRYDSDPLNASLVELARIRLKDLATLLMAEGLGRVLEAKVDDTDGSGGKHVRLTIQWAPPGRPFGREVNVVRGYVPSAGSPPGDDDHA